MESHSNRIKLLLVDDEEDFLVSTKKALDRRNIEVTTARNGAEALSVCRTRKFDIAVLDVKMPGIDGVELFYKMKTEIPGIPIIILTGHGTIAQAFRTSKDGIYDFQAKPCDIDVLTKKIKEAVRNRWGEEKNFLAAIREYYKSGIRLLALNNDEDCRAIALRVKKKHKIPLELADSECKMNDFLGKNIVDVIILDLSLCTSNCLELLQQLKKEHKNVQIILISEYSKAESALRGIKSGAWDYFFKPIDLRQLVWSILKAHRNRLEELAREQKKTVDEILERFPE